MSTIDFRVPFQIYKADRPDASIQDFNSLAPEAALPYKILASEEALTASLALVESTEEHRKTYAVSTIHSAYVYLNQLASYIPLMSRSQNAKRVVVNTDILFRVVALYGSAERDLLARMSSPLKEGDPSASSSESVSVSALSSLEQAFAALEKKYRQEVKESGGKVEMLRKVTVAALAPRKSSTTALQDRGDANGSGGHEGCLDTGHRRRPRSASQVQPEEGRAPKSDCGDDDDGGGGEPSQQHARHEEGEGAAASSPSSRPPRVKGAATATLLVLGRLRALTNAEKKAVTILNQIIDILARVYANKFNDLIPVFDHLLERTKAVQDIIDAERAAYEGKEDKKPPEPFHETSLKAVFDALAESTQIFRDDDDCRLELDEDLLHPIAHACLTVINQIEGYATTPFQGPSEEERQKKLATRALFRLKREEAARKVLERAKAKEELAQKKEEERRLLRIRLGGGVVDEEDLQDDEEIKNPVPIGYVHYEKTLPLDNTELLETALFVWSMLVSVPQPLMLSQMPFSLFMKGLLEDDQDANGLMEEVTECLLDLVLEHVRVNSPSTPRITTRGKNWFDALVEFVGVVSGHKKRRQPQRRAPSTSLEDEDSGEFSSSSSSSDSSMTTSDDEEGEEEEEGEGEEEEKSKSNEAAEADGDSVAGAATAAEKGGVQGDQEVDDGKDAEGGKADEEEDVDSFGVELKGTMERITALRSLATWGNVDLADRLNLLKFCVLEALASDKVMDEADKLFKAREEDVAEMEKHLKELREDAEKEMRGLQKNLSSSAGGAKAAGTATSTPASSPTSKGERPLEVAYSSEEYEEKKAQILNSAEKKRKAAYARHFSKQDGQDIGAIIQPIGMDRYKRLYWRFPLDRRVLVQTTAATRPDFPLIPEPDVLRRQRKGSSLFLDDEEEEAMVLLGGGHRRKATKASHEQSTSTAEAAEDTNEEGESDDTAQRAWGVIPGEYIAAFAEGLDPRGVREAALRRGLEEMADYVAGMEEFHDGRATRSRTRTFGYLNKLKAFF